MRRYLPLIAGAVVLGVSGVVHGLWTDRWNVSSAVDAACARLDAVPATLGEWDSQPLELDARQLAVAETAGHLARRYVHRRSGQQVSLILLCGRPGPLAVHRPDICYTGAGYQLAGEPEKWTPTGSETQAQFWTTRFFRPGNETAALRVFWTWSSDGNWVAADQPRLAFAQASALYKLYLVQPLAQPDEPLAGGVAQDFLQVLLPELKRCLHPE
jgi:hypothetical protein